MDVEYCVVKVRVGIRPRSSAKQAFPFAAAQKCHMLHEVGNALLICILVHTPCAARNI